jgi:ABC-type branched-subunit amino acid transport system permease subunit
MRKIHIGSRLAEQIGKNPKFPKLVYFARSAAFTAITGTYIVEPAAFGD